jgi:tryptophanyl-tRNA synthetase
MKQRMVSGIKPSGDLHIGNYLGAIAQWTKLQEEYDVMLFIADLHAITVPQQPDNLRRRTIEIAKVYLASGIDPFKVTIFVQSQIHEHAELCWILNTVTRVGDLEKMTQFKDKSADDIRETAGVGLFDYPVLMAGDIMMYDAQFVPVGDDQVQHIELARTIGRRFNKRFGEVFTMPKPLLQTSGGARIMALDNPVKKMSKSAHSEGSYIALNDEPEKARKKIMKAMTDSGTEIVYNDDKPALKNLITIYALLTGKTTEEIEKMYSDRGYSDFKTGLADAVVIFLQDFQTKFKAISDEEVMRVLKEGAEKVRPLAQQKIREVKKLVGFVS